MDAVSGRGLGGGGGGGTGTGQGYCIAICLSVNGSCPFWMIGIWFIICCAAIISYCLITRTMSDACLCFGWEYKDILNTGSPSYWW